MNETIAHEEISATFNSVVKQDNGIILYYDKIQKRY